MGKRNNYLTLEQASQMLGKPTSYFMSLISKGELGAKVAGGQWQIDVRDFDKIRDAFPPEPHEVAPNFLPNRTDNEPDRVTESGEITNPQQVSAKRSNTNPRKVELEKRVVDLNKRLQKLQGKISRESHKYKRVARYGRTSKNVGNLRSLLLQRKQLERQRDKVLRRLSMPIQTEKEIKQEHKVKGTQVDKGAKEKTKGSKKRKTKHKPPNQDHLIYEEPWKRQLRSINREIKALKKPPLSTSENQERVQRLTRLREQIMRANGIRPPKRDSISGNKQGKRQWITFVRSERNR